MSSGMSSDQIIKYEIIEHVKRFPNISLRIFPDSSNQDQELVEHGGLTFSHNGIDYGSCDAGWFSIQTQLRTPFEVPLIALEGTDALNRGSSGDAQYQRFHHALGAVKNGCIGIYYLRHGACKLQLDLYEMAYNATKYEQGAGVYLIIQDLAEVSKLLELIVKYGRKSDKVLEYLDSWCSKMHQVWYEQKFSLYSYDWQKFAEKRSTIISPHQGIIKCTGRMKRNFTDGSQRAGHIAVGEMYLSKYLFYGKKLIYLCPRMTKDDVEYLDKHKKTDKEWTLLRKEENVFYKTMDDIIGLPNNIKEGLLAIKDAPLKGEALVKFNIYKEYITDGLKKCSLRITE